MYAVVIEHDPQNGSYAATAPDFDGDVVGIGKSEAEAVERFRNALAAYIAFLRERGEPVPAPRFTVMTIPAA